jgi:hypothetical protein
MVKPDQICMLALPMLSVVIAIFCLDGRSFAVDAVDAAKLPSRLQFNRDIRPILAENCFACHGFDGASREADLRLDSRDGAISTKNGQAAIVPKEPESSLLIERIHSSDPDEMMPPPHSGKQLTKDDREKLRQWISEGAEYEKHWSYVAPVRLDPPKFGNVSHPIDRFVITELRKAGLSPSEQAEAATLIRRLSLDLIGLPPTLDELASFLEASSENAERAYEDLVDRLLSNPHYGERWGRWWLDQARYADSNGYSTDAPRKIWKYRDWVIKALNEDMPFDQFSIEQLAGDLLPNATDDQIIATGFHRNTQINQEGGIDKEQFRIESVFDRVATTGTVWLGMTVGCCQCHDHKFDPIEQREYYRLFAFFNNQEEPTHKVYDPNIDIKTATRELRVAEKTLEEFFVEHAEAFAKWEAGLVGEFRKGLSPNVKKALAIPAEDRSLVQKRILFETGFQNLEEFRDLNDRYLELDEILNQGVTTLVMKEREDPRKTTIYIKGDFTRPADEVTPGTPSILHPMEQVTGLPNRLDLARWIVSPRNPLTSRVIVNRIWQQYFGRGLVETENDFGMLGSRPSHPELLDWLACELQDSGWSLKSIHRLIVSSATYRQSSVYKTATHSKDHHNHLLGRQTRLRLDGELVRDVALTASGLLAPTIGGPSVFPPIPEGVMGQGQVKRTWTVSTGSDRYRRGMYTFLYRATPPPSLNVFDVPEGYSPCTRRNRSNTPLQSLTLMNDMSYFEFAQQLERIIQREGISVAFARCTSRQPSSEELAILEKLDSLTAARTLLNLDETITRE